MTPDVQAFFDAATYTVSYIVSDPATARAAVIDPVLDYDASSGRTQTRSADAMIAHALERGLSVDWILETHIHADHLSAAGHIRQHLGGKVCVGAGVEQVQQTFKALFNAGDAFAADGSEFDALLADGQDIPLGEFCGRVLHTPGHTPACSTYLFGDVAFVGDTLFMPDYGTARCDFPGGDARTLYASIRRILELPPQTRIFTCHDYGGDGRGYAWQSTVAEQRRDNIHIRDGIDVEDFVALRESRDAGLDMPALILPAVQVNMRAGVLPPSEENGISYLKIPLNGI